MSAKPLHIKNPTPFHKAQLNMAVLYFENIAHWMAEIFESGAKARYSLRNSSIIEYFSLVEQFYLHLSPTQNDYDNDIIEDGLKFISKNIDFERRTVIKRSSTVKMIMEIQREIYRLAQRRRILLPFDSETNPYTAMKRSLGV